MFSRVVRSPYPLVSPPLTMLIFVRIGNASFATSCPATSAWPEVGRRRVHWILTIVVVPAPFGPRSPNSSPSGIARSTPSRAVTGPSAPPFSDFRRLRIFRLGLKTRVRAFVSTANAISPLGSPWGPRRLARATVRSHACQLLVPGHVAGDPVSHDRRGDVRELGDFRLVVVEVVRERVGELSHELAGDALDVRRPNVSHDPPGSFRGRAFENGRCT